MTQSETVEQALGLRQKLVIGQALGIACKVLCAAKHPRKELSNAHDMETVGRMFFEPFFSAELNRPLPELENSYK